MSYRVLAAGDALWRPSNVMGVPNTDVAGQLHLAGLAARLWRMAPGQANTWHRHRTQTEVYVVLEGTGRIRVGDETLTLPPLSALAVEPSTLRQPFNDTDEDVLWLIFGAPREAVTSTLEMSDDMIAELYPDGLTAMPPQLGGPGDEPT